MKRLAHLSRQLRLYKSSSGRAFSTSAPTGKYSLSGKTLESVYSEHKDTDPFADVPESVRTVPRHLFEKSLPFPECLVDVTGARPSFFYHISKAFGSAASPLKDVEVNSNAKFVDAAKYLEEALELMSKEDGAYSESTLKRLEEIDLLVKQHPLARENASNVDDFLSVLRSIEFFHVAQRLYPNVFDPELQFYNDRLFAASANQAIESAIESLAQIKKPAVAFVFLRLLAKHELVVPDFKYAEHFAKDGFLNVIHNHYSNLMANSSRAVTMLQGHGESEQGVAQEIGKHLGLAIRVSEDVVGVNGTAKTSIIGYPANNDLTCGIPTGMVLYARKEKPELQELIDRHFNKPGDVQKAVELVKETSAVQVGVDLTKAAVENAVAAALQLPASPHKSAIINLAGRVYDSVKL